MILGNVCKPYRLFNSTKFMKSYFLFLLTGALLLSCKKEKNSEGSGQLEFLMHTSLLKSGSGTDIDSSASSDLTWIVYSIEDVSGKVIIDSEKIALQDFSEYGHYSSKTIKLTGGDYRLTQFLVLDWRNMILYASPVKGAPRASSLEAPLPLSFNIQQGKLTQLTPGVLSAYGAVPEDFGYTTFGYKVANTFDFLIGVFIYNDSAKNNEMTSAIMNIKADATTDIYYGPLDVGLNDTSGIVCAYDSIGVTNKITVPERYKNYTVIVSKPGYKTYNQTFRKDELKLYFRSVDKGPLVIILDK